uniref:Uncharacterized protein n=1 Tax=Romanomermis culicivorax TaxID=13658 RepID=A0A915ILX6_ROMCU
MEFFKVEFVCRFNHENKRIGPRTYTFRPKMDFQAERFNLLRSIPLDKAIVLAFLMWKSLCHDFYDLIWILTK